MVGVDHRGLNVRVTHIRLHVGQRPRLDRERPERVPQIMEDHRV